MLEILRQVPTPRFGYGRAVEVRCQCGVVFVTRARLLPRTPKSCGCLDRKHDPDKRRAWKRAYEKTPKYRALKKKWKTQNPDKTRLHDKVQNDKRTIRIRELRIAALDKYGNACRRCGFKDTRALQFDHVNGGGNKERMSIPRITFLRDVLKDDGTKYQLLCANCNWIKRHENNELRMCDGRKKP